MRRKKSELWCKRVGPEIWGPAKGEEPIVYTLRVKSVLSYLKTSFQVTQLQELYSLSLCRTTMIIYVLRAIQISASVYIFISRISVKIVNDFRIIDKYLLRIVLSSVTLKHIYIVSSIIFV